MNKISAWERLIILAKISKCLYQSRKLKKKFPFILRKSANCKIGEINVYNQHAEKWISIGEKIVDRNRK